MPECAWARWPASRQMQFTQMVDQLQKSVREVHLTVSWKEGS